MSSAVPVVTRRRVLAGGTVLAVLGAVASACGSGQPPQQVDELDAQSRQARHDSELATAAAAGAPPQMAAALKQVAAERARHAVALDTEIARVSGRTPASSSASPSPTPTQAAAPPPLTEVLNSLRASADSATRLATASSGYRAGLLASIAAACTAAYTVALAPKGATG
ncbi:hypothetical protein [Mycobacterium xenopi]|uniref:Tat pathway signal protein n=1 Tax=Mycobacterium xenopi TaxID=1789 RepID=A0AAD1H2Y4_MYCXE|nr:hypothetical protein [Mycobacterium xenopi]MDA3639405.1 hypothetical protein [Mycobacterium xenopi]MDA3658316.1 hypothetical protein [Mycobacterium xenopi]MDA3662072.1 hypothetical protein [Mycobacterium xenopi]ORX20539.1 hypothetical protein AWC32_05280 [Mycobacterium xenopi]SPX89086.1 conserved transmembrane alanine rich protein [Mycobacterium xenopi]